MKNDTLASSVQSETELTLCASNAIDFDGQTFTPDGTKGYFQFTMSHAFPVRNAHGTGVAPAVIASSFKTLLHQNVNFEHQLQAYHKKPGERTSVTDRILGSVVAVKFQDAPMGGWRFDSDATKTPGVMGVGTYAKMAQGVNHIVGEHLGGRHRWAVSCEVEYSLMSSGFAVALNGAEPKFNFTPPDLLAAGFEYIPWASAPEDLQNTFSRAKNKVVKDWGKREVTVLMGGLTGPVHYAGIGIVKYGAEGTAKITRMAASGQADPLAPFLGLKDLLKKSLTRI